MSLARLVCEQARLRPDAPAVIDVDGTTSYGDLDISANRIAHALLELGVRCGDRVALWMSKSGAAVSAIQGALRVGAIYVPLDPQSPCARVMDILQDCRVRALFTEDTKADAIGDFLSRSDIAVICRGAPGLRLARILAWSHLDAFPSDPPRVPTPSPDDVAYILYTSGSTGKPKGVCLSHRNALAFVEWATGEVEIGHEDRLSNHAPFHFDLSVFDLYAAFHAGASVHLVAEGNSLLHQRWSISCTATRSASGTPSHRRWFS